jgi:uncharacterized phage-associated protein
MTQEIPVERMTMASVFDVAAYILETKGSMTGLKLQKLVYYCQAWSLVWDERPLFAERIEAWANGPIVPELYFCHKGQFQADRATVPNGHPETLTVEQRETVDAVLEFYGNRDGQWLADLTHAEDPWRKARRGLEPGERGSEEITYDSMTRYYSTVQADRATSDLSRMARS